jgi:hypothetical protein
VQHCKGKQEITAAARDRLFAEEFTAGLFPVCFARA